MTEYTVEQQKANRDKWVAALRSGEFQQGKGKLRSRNDEFCCLGVACEVAVREGVIGYTVTPGFRLEYDGSSQVLSVAMQEWLGIEGGECGGTRGEITYRTSDDVDSTAGSLTELNDYARWSFAQIADLIESDAVKVRS